MERAVSNPDTPIQLTESLNRIGVLGVGNEEPSFPLTLQAIFTSPRSGIFPVAAYLELILK